MSWSVAWLWCLNEHVNIRALVDRKRSCLIRAFRTVRQNLKAYLCFTELEIQGGNLYWHWAVFEVIPLLKRTWIGRSVNFQSLSVMLLRYLSPQNGSAGNLGMVFTLVIPKPLFRKGEYTAKPIKPKIFYCLALYWRSFWFLKHCWFLPKGEIHDTATEVDRENYPEFSLKYIILRWIFWGEKWDMKQVSLVKTKSKTPFFF